MTELWNGNNDGGHVKSFMYHTGTSQAHVLWVTGSGLGLIAHNMVSKAGRVLTFCLSTERTLSSGLSTWTAPPLYISHDRTNHTTIPTFLFTSLPQERGDAGPWISHH